MKTVTRTILAAGIVLLAPATTSFSIEGLQISVQCPDIIVGWPSQPGENFILQWRPTLDPSTPWVTLTSCLPADWTTNWTTFVHSNMVQCASGQTSATSMMTGGTTASQTFSAALVDAVLAGQPSYPLTMPPMPPVRTNGIWVAWEDVFGPQPPIMMPISDALRQRVLAAAAQGTLLVPGSGGPQPNGAQPLDNGPGDGGSPIPDPGFYQVVKDGVRIWGLASLTGGVVLSNTVSIPFEAGCSDWTTCTNVLGVFDSATLVVDGTKFPGNGTLSAPPIDPWQFNIDTALLENGDHTVWVDVTWQNPDNYAHPVFSRSSDPFTITVSNAIYYPQWETEIGEADISAYLAKSICTNTDWQLDIYDSGSNLVRTLTGHTTDGTIEALWNMVDENNVARTNADTDPWFDSVLTVSDPATKTLPRKNQRRKDWPDHGKWVIAYQDFFKFEYDENGWQQQAINEFAYTAQAYGGYWLYYPQPGQTNDIGQTYPIRFQKANHYDPSITSAAIAKDHALLIYFLTNGMAARNFYMRSHGSPSTMAGLLPASHVNAAVKQRYRFVYLDGCDTAKGDWDKAFGINGPGTFDISYYQTYGIRPAAFCGYNQEVDYATGGPIWRNGVLYDDTVPWQVGGFTLNFLFYWDAAEYDLAYSFSLAKQNLPVVNSYYMGDGLQIYGYDRLGVDSYNYKTDWP